MLLRLAVWLTLYFARAHCTTFLFLFYFYLFLFFLFFFITVYCYVVWSNGWPALMGSDLSGNPPLHINILCCMLLMCLQVVNKRSLSQGMLPKCHILSLKAVVG